MSRGQSSSLERQSTSKRVPVTKQFKAEFDLDSDQGHTSIRTNRKGQGEKKDTERCPPRVRKIFPSGTLTLERQPSGNPIDFDIYDNADLPFLDQKTEVGRMVSKNIVQSTLDDDVMTDEEMINAANKILGREVERAIRMFNSGFDRTAQIRNLKI